MSSIAKIDCKQYDKGRPKENGYITTIQQYIYHLPVNRAVAK
jgi:hypothetical protein